MRLFIRHIGRSIKKSPLQPIIILITLIISVTTFIVAVKTVINASLENRDYRGLDDFICDITVKPSDKDKMRFLFDDGMGELLGDGGWHIGRFDLTGLVNLNGKREIVQLYATALTEADDFYGLRFSEYGRITEQNLNKTVILSADAAKKHGLNIGDSLTLNLLGESLELSVEAIALSDGIMKESFGIINIGAVTHALARANPAIASLGDSIIPYSRIDVIINNEEKIDEYAALISGSKAFSSKTVIKEAENVGNADYLRTVAFAVVIITSSIVIILSALVIATSLGLLEKKRRKETALFLICGAERADLDRISTIEYLIYSLPAAILGLLLSIPVCREINRIYVWEIEGMSFEPYDVLLALVGAPIIILITSALRKKRDRTLTVSALMSDELERRELLTPLKPIIISGLVSLVLFIAALITPPEYRFIPGFASAAVFLVFLYLLLPRVLELISSIGAWLLERFKTPPATPLLALKNIKKSHPLLHSGRLLVILFSLISLIFVCLSTLAGELVSVKNLIDCRYVSVGADEGTDEIIEKLDFVDETFRFAIIKEITTEHNVGTVAISAEDDALPYIYKDIAPKSLPKEGEIVISSGISILENKKVGDEITLMRETKSYTFRVTEVLPSRSNIIFIDARSIDETNELLCIRTDASENSEDYLKLSNALEVRASALIDRDQILSTLTVRLDAYVRLLGYVALLSLITVMIGIGNLMYSSYTARARERQLYYVVGMTKGNVRLLGFAETLLIGLITLILLPLCAILLIGIMDISINSFGVDLIV